MRVFCEVESCAYCIDGECSKGSINIITIGNDDGICEDYEEAEDY